MKRLMIFFLILFVFSTSAYAQMGMMGCQEGQMGQGSMMGAGQQPMMNCPMMQPMPCQGMMQGCRQMPMTQPMQGGMMGGMMGQGMMCPQMQNMTGQGMMAPEMMQMMMNMIDMQEKMMKGLKASEKKMMMKDLSKMKERIQNMMSMRTTMMGGMMGQQPDVCQCSLNCAEQWLKKAIDLHEVHIKDPKTATEASQMEMMDQMKKAYGCLTGARCGMGEATPKESEGKETEKEKTPKRDEHGH